jgi:uncharacterized membrane protein
MEHLGESLVNTIFWLFVILVVVWIICIPKDMERQRQDELYEEHKRKAKEREKRQESLKRKKELLNNISKN